MTCLYLKQVHVEEAESDHIEHNLYTPSLINYSGNTCASQSGSRPTTPPPRIAPPKRNSLKDDKRVGILDRKLKERSDQGWLVDHNILKDTSRKGLTHRFEEASALLEEKLRRRPRLNSEEMDQLYNEPKKSPQSGKQRNRSRSVSHVKSEINALSLSASSSASSDPHMDLPHQRERPATLTPRSPSLQAWARDRRKKTTLSKRNSSPNALRRRETKSEDKDTGSSVTRPAFATNLFGDPTAVSDHEGSRPTSPLPDQSGERPTSGMDIAWDHSDWSTF